VEAGGFSGIRGTGSGGYGCRYSKNCEGRARFHGEGGRGLVADF